jgi:hypothetical protein
MRCNQFIDGYSDFRDGLVTDELRVEYERHLAACDHCTRYDRVVRRGVEVCCDLPVAEPSPDFLPRLQHRIFHVEDGARLTSRRALGSAALVAVAGVGLLAVTWLPFATRMSVEIQLPPVAVDAPPASLADRPSLFGDGPYVAPRAQFLVPFHPTLDGASDLFSPRPLALPVGSDTGAEVPASGQLDSSR